MIPTVMGVLNVTPDSFSDGGRFETTDAAVAGAAALIAAGAGIVDIGGESTRPGAVPVDPADELARVVPVVEEVARHDAVRAGVVELSVDTRNESVARAAVAAGATIVNDVSASLGPLAGELGVGWIAMHMAGSPADMQARPTYGDVVEEVLDVLVAAAERGRRAGAPRVWIDPGIGFGKTLEHNLALLAALDRFVATGRPVAIGVSRKTSLGVLSAWADGSPDPTGTEDRLEASLAVATWAMHCGVGIVRAHDVQAHVRAAKVVAGEIPAAA